MFNRRLAMTSSRFVLFFSVYIRGSLHDSYFFSLVVVEDDIFDRNPLGTPPSGSKNVQKTSKTRFFHLPKCSFLRT
jgi:hypothetical protein